MSQKASKIKRFRKKANFKANIYIRKSINIKMENEKKYVSTDLYLVAYLKTKGHKFNVEKVRNKSYFSFIESTGLLLDVNEYLTGNGSCEPLAYTNAIKNIKNLLFNNKI